MSHSWRKQDVRWKAKPNAKGGHERDVSSYERHMSKHGLNNASLARPRL